MDVTRLNQILAPAAVGAQLTESDAQLLKAIAVGGVSRGSVAMRRAKLTPKQMIEATKHLVAAGLILADGDTSDDVMIQYAMFSPNPKKIALVQHGLSIAV